VTLLNITGVAAVAGGSTPLAFLLGGIACLALAFVVIGFTRRMASAGYAYTYASRSLGKEAGFMAGWLYFFGFICFVPMTMSAVGFLAADLLGVSPKLWILFFFIGMALFLVLLDDLLGHDRLRREQRRQVRRGPGRAEDHRDHVRVHRRHRVLLPDPRQPELEPARACGGPGDRRHRVRRRLVRVGAPGAAWHPQVDPVPRVGLGEIGESGLTCGDAGRPR